MVAEILTPAQVAYREYLQSEHWRGLRLEAFQTYGRKCSKCPATCRLDVHHLRYRHPWTSAVVADLQILCRQCHGVEHGIVTVIPIAEKRREQKAGRLESLLQRVNSGQPLKQKHRHFVSNKLLRGNARQRGIANEIFQKNARLTPKGRKKWNSHPPGLERLLMKQKLHRQQKALRKIAKYATAFRVRW